MQGVARRSPEQGKGLAVGKNGFRRDRAASVLLSNGPPSRPFGQDWNLRSGGYELNELIGKRREWNPQEASMGWAVDDLVAQDIIWPRFWQQKAWEGQGSSRTPKTRPGRLRSPSQETVSTIARLEFEVSLLA